MAIPENQLETWSHSGAGIGSKETYAAIQLALQDENAPYIQRNPKIFLQGSYKNDTNVWAESDVDVVIRMDSVFYYDISDLGNNEQAEFRATHPASEYRLEHFKAEVTSWLIDWFREDVVPGNRAVEISAKNGRRKADVLISSVHRRYYNAGFMGQQMVEGVQFLTNAGEWIVNYPEQHSNNLTAKHQDTKEWLKPTIRIFKNMRNRLVNNEVIERGLAPSYFVEGLLYNVPSEMFGQNWATTVYNCLNWLHSKDRSTFLCANGEHRLLGEGTPTSWPEKNCKSFLDATIQRWNEWN